MASMAFNLASGLFTAAGQLQQGRAAKQAADFKATVQEQQAAAERRAAAAESEDFRRRGSARRAASRARLSGSGVAATGSPLLVDEAFTKNIALGSARLINRGEVAGTRLEQQATLSRFEGRNAKRAGKLAALGTAFRTASNAGQSLLSGSGSFG